MAIENPYNLPEKNLATYNRQRCINLLEKICKNLFRMFRDTSTTKTQVSERFSVLKKKLDQLGDVYLDTEYHREMRTYIEHIAHTLAGEYDLDEIREINMTRLNRLQKIKNATGYKRKKYTRRMKGEV